MNHLSTHEWRADQLHNSILVVIWKGQIKVPLPCCFDKFRPWLLSYLHTAIIVEIVGCDRPKSSLLQSCFSPCCWKLQKEGVLHKVNCKMFLFLTKLYLKYSNLLSFMQEIGVISKDRKADKIFYSLSLSKFTSLWEFLASEDFRMLDKY